MSAIGREASRMSVSGQEVLPYVRHRSEGLPGCLGVVGRPYAMSTIGREAPGCTRVAKRPSQMYGGGREVFPDFRDRSEIPPGCASVVGIPYTMSAIGREAPYMSRMVKRPSRMSRSGWEVFPDIREWSGEPSRSPGVVWRPFRMSGSGQEAFADVQEWSGGPPG